MAGLLHVAVVIVLVVACDGDTPTTASVDTLRLVHVLFRHGDRTPTTVPYVTDPNVEFWTKQGFGKLTKTGMNQAYNLGRYLRQRYSEFLNTTYDPLQVYARSTDFDRTLMSAYCTLAGLFPPVGDQIWNTDLLWQPIPVHTVPKNIDYLLNPDSYCPLYAEIIFETFNSTRALEQMKKHQDLFDLLTEKSGQNVTSFYDVYDIEGGVQIERWNNLTQPEWLTDQVFEEMVDVKNIYLSYLHPDNQTRRLRGGPLLGEMLNNMKSKAADASNQREICLYTAHDATIIGLMSAMGLPYNGTNPPYTAAFIVELHLINGTYFVQMWYRTDPAVDPALVSMPGCDDLCPLSTFQQLANPSIPEDVKKECRAC